MSEVIVTLKKGEGRLLKSGGLWIYDNEIASVTGDYTDGDMVQVQDYNGYPMGVGYINSHSKIRIRMMTRCAEQEISESFLRMRLQNAWDYRKKTVDISSCRVVFGEADFLPGIVVDKFADVLVVQSLALGIDRYKEQIVDLLKEILAQDGIQIRGVYERSDAKVRTQEGMERVKGFIGEGFDTQVEIVENGVKYYVDVEDGQKTGFFLDQKYNRQAIRSLCQGAKVLDCFTHTGSFALNAGGTASGCCFFIARYTIITRVSTTAFAIVRIDFLTQRYQIFPKNTPGRVRKDYISGSTYIYTLTINTNHESA